MLLIISLSIIIIVFNPFHKEDDFEFKTLSTGCDNFNISGNITYNENKAAIYITNIKYCGGDDSEEYKKIECVLYESNNNIETKINSYVSNHENIKLEEFLQGLTLSVDKYEKTCKEYKDDSLYLSINATSYNDKITTYKVPLRIDYCD